MSCQEDSSRLSVATCHKNHKNLWDEIVEKSEKVKKEIQEYIRSKNIETEVYPNPTVAYLDKTLFPLLNDAMIEMFGKVKEDDSFYRRKSTLIGLDFISEYLYNMNPNYPDRKSNWTYIFDMDWVENFLQERPRPYYPFHLVWSRNFGALKIQAYMRGYWTRRRDDVQEVRQFWKDYRADKRSKICIKSDGAKYRSNANVYY